MNTLDTAIQMALIFHGGTRNKHDGEFYVLHLQRVAIGVRDAGHDEIHQAVAWLHDSVEDTDLTIPQIMSAFPLSPEIATSVAALTKPDDGSLSNEDYYKNLLLFPIARAVKLHDLHDNFRRNHLIEDEATKLRMAAKYSLGMDILLGT